MTLAEHFFELRKRLFRSALAIVALAIGSFAFYGPLFRFLMEPYCSLPASERGGAGRDCQLIFTHPIDAFTIRLRVALLAGVVLSSPIWVYQLWAFVTPGLRRNERKWLLIFAGSSSALFAAGVTIAYFMLRTALAFLLGAVGNYATPLLDIEQYLSFVTHVLVMFGISFELPLVIVLLNAAGIVSAARLASWRRMEIVLVTVLAAAVTPSQDPFTMMGLAAPLWVLYELAVLVARAHDRRVARRAAESPYAGLSPDEAGPLPPPTPPADIAAFVAPEGAPEDSPTPQRDRIS